MPTDLSCPTCGGTGWEPVPDDDRSDRSTIPCPDCGGSGVAAWAVEAGAAKEHEQWMEWSKVVAPEVSADRQERWASLWVPYEELSESSKDSDREWARTFLVAVREVAEGSDDV